MVISNVAIQNSKPIIYVFKESRDRGLKETLVESFSDYIVLWYHWPYDGHGPTQRDDDYEPVILIFRDENVYAMGVRPHKRHDFSTNLDREHNRPIVIFDSPWHGPIIKTPSSFGNLICSFLNPRFFVKVEEYDLINKRPPKWFVKNDTNKAIYDYADEIKERLLL